MSGLVTEVDGVTVTAETMTGIDGGGKRNISKGAEAMRGRDWFKIVVCGLASVTLFTGCGLFGKKKTQPPTGGPDDVSVTSVPVVGDGNVSMPGGQRTADGVPVGEKFDNVLFDYDNYQIKSAETAKADKVAEYMKANADVRLVTEGHCDERGSSEYNLSLGEHRALAVRAYLVSHGIDGTRIQTRSYGKEKPLESGHNEAAWHLNRRVEFLLSK